MGEISLASFCSLAYALIELCQSSAANRAVKSTSGSAKLVRQYDSSLQPVGSVAHTVYVLLAALSRMHTPLEMVGALT